MISYLENLRDKQNKEEVFMRRHQAKKRVEVPPEPETPVKVKKIEIIGKDSDLIDNNGEHLRNFFFMKYLNHWCFHV